MFFRYAKRRTTRIININNIEAVEYNDVEADSEGNTKELLITLISGKVIKERRKAEEIYNQIRFYLEKNNLFTFSSNR